MELPQLMVKNYRTIRKNGDQVNFNFFSPLRVVICWQNGYYGGESEPAKYLILCGWRGLRPMRDVKTQQGPF